MAKNELVNTLTLKNMSEKKKGRTTLPPVNTKPAEPTPIKSRTRSESANKEKEQQAKKSSSELSKSQPTSKMSKKDEMKKTDDLYSWLMNGKEDFYESEQIIFK